MAKRNRDKFIQKAWESLGYIDDSKPEDDLWFTESGIKTELSEYKNAISTLEDIILRSKESIESMKSSIILLENVINQAEIEEFKSRNPQAKEVFKI